MTLASHTDTSIFGEAWSRLSAAPFAHRGLWAPGGAPENSLAAFQAACAAGYGIELDVRLSADGEAIVFHDANLDRLTDKAGRVADHSAAELRTARLNDTDETIPTLSEALVEIGHRAMVLIELKTPFGEVGVLEKRVSEVLLDHHGPTAVIGFNPYSHAWFDHHHPQILRGLSSYRWNDDDATKLAPEQRKSFAKLEQIAIAKPHFLALDLDLVSAAAAQTRRADGLPLVGWTARTSDQWAAARAFCDNIIFEGFAA